MNNKKNTIGNLIALIIIIFGGIILVNRKTLVTKFVKSYIYSHDIIIPEANKYKRDYNFNYVQRTNNFTPDNKQDILNILYTVLDNGWTEFSFFCEDSYETCTEDANDLFDGSNEVSNLNNFVSPYNNFSKIRLDINSFGKVTISVTKLYSDEVIELLNTKVEEIYNSVTNNNMTEEEKIKAIHDYIVNNTTYDQKRAEGILSGNDPDPNSYSHTAFGPLYDGIGICGGYSDAMALFLDKMGIKNYKVSTNDHVWNAVYLNNKWLHIDLTWDDPVTNTGDNILTYNFFLIDDATLISKEVNQHSFNKEVYSEFK